MTINIRLYAECTKCLSEEGRPCRSLRTRTRLPYPHKGRVLLSEMPQRPIIRKPMEQALVDDPELAATIVLALLRML